MNLKERAKQLKTDIPAVFLALRRKETPVLAKIIAAITVAYALSPVDLIPDFIPVIGLLDDVILLAGTGCSCSKANTVRCFRGMPERLVGFVERRQAETMVLYAAYYSDLGVACFFNCKNNLLMNGVDSLKYQWFEEYCTSKKGAYKE